MSNRTEIPYKLKTIDGEKEIAKAKCISILLLFAAKVRPMYAHTHTILIVSSKLIPIKNNKIQIKGVRKHIYSHVSFITANGRTFNQIREPTNNNKCSVRKQELR